MNKFVQTRNSIGEQTLYDGNREPLSPREMDAIRTALTQAAEIERGDKVVVPRELTAENGMKKTLGGEFFEHIDVDDGNGCYIPVKVPVSWTTIKEIHRAMITASEETQ